MGYDSCSCGNPKTKGASRCRRCYGRGSGIAMGQDEYQRRARERYAANAETVLARQRAKYAIRKEEITARMRARYHADPARRVAAQTKYHKRKDRILELERARRAANPERDHAAGLRRNGFSRAMYLEFLDRQAGVCAICRGPQVSVRNRHFVLDHDHETGKARGLLCDRCNRGIGQLADDPARLRAAADYIEAAKQ